MSLIPWRGKREGREGDLSPIVALRHEMDRLFDSFVREPFGAIDWPSWATGKWSPAVDVAEDDKELTVRAELPGIDPKDLEVSVLGNQLVLSGEKKESSETKEKGCLSERDPLRLVPPHHTLARRDRHGARRRPIRQRRADAAAGEDRAGGHEADRGQGEVT